MTKKKNWKMERENRQVLLKSLFLFGGMLSVLLLHGQKRMTLENFLRQAKQSSAYQSLTLQKQIDDYYFNVRSRQHDSKLNLSFNGPNFSNSLSPVLQPNGTREMKETYDMSGGLNLSYSKPIVPLGGDLSLSTGVNTTYYISPNESRYYSLNLLNVAYSQSLTKINKLKREKETQTLQKEILSIEQQLKKENFMSVMVNIYFDLLLKEKIYRKQKKDYELAKYLYKKTARLYHSGKKLKSELLRAEIFELEQMAAFHKSKEQYELQYHILCTYVNLSGYELSIPVVGTQLSIDSQKIISMAMQKVLASQWELKLKQVENEVDDAKRQYMDIGFNISLGVSTYAEEFSQLSVNKRQVSGGGITIKIPIKDNGAYRSKYMTAKLKKEKYLLDLDQEKKKISEEIKADLTMLKVLMSSVIITKKQMEIQKELNKEIIELYSMGKIDLSKVMESISKQSQQMISEINIRKNIYQMIYKYRSRYLIDVVRESFI